MTQGKNTTESPDRIPRLDVLRAVAILFVFGFHYSLTLTKLFEAAAAHEQAGALASGINSLFSNVMLFGSSGVPLFFVISGFCIHLAFLRSRRIFQAKDFYWRRFLRIYPAYFIALAFFSILGLFRILPPLNLKMFLTHLLLVHNILDYRLLLSINAAFWSLAVEWQFYLLYPLVLWVRQKTDMKTCLFLTVLICIFFQVTCSLWPAFDQFTHDQTSIGRTFGTWCDWVLGACLAEAALQQQPLFRYRSFWLLSSLVLVVIGRSYPVIFEFRFMLDSLFFAVVMEMYLARRGPLIWVERALVPVGIISYSIYLWHMPLMKPLSLFLHARIPLPVNALWEIVFFLPLTFLVLAPLFVASYWLGEKVLPDYLRRWKKMKTSPRSNVPDLDEILSEAKDTTS